MKFFHSGRLDLTVAQSFVSSGKLFCLKLPLDVFFPLWSYFAASLLLSLTEFDSLHLCIN